MRSARDSPEAPKSVSVGDSYSFRKEITEELVEEFAKLSGDFNPVHMDEAFCSRHGIGARMVHGMLVLSFVSALLGMNLPGGGTVWLSQAFDFMRPVRVGDVLTISGRVTGKSDGGMLGGPVYTIAVAVKNQKNEVVIRGHNKVTVK